MISVSSEVQERFPGLYYGEVVLENVVVEESGNRIEEEKQLLLEGWRGKSKEDLNGIEIIQTYREFHRSLGLNPKKKPPSMENLIVRCVLRGFLPKINNVVDACNIAAVKHLVPMAAFDLDKFVGKTILHFSKGGEVIQPIGRTQPESVEPDLVILSDEANVISIFPYRDSDLYKLQPTTRNVLLVACHIDGVEEQRIDDALAFASNLIATSSQ